MPYFWMLLLTCFSLSLSFFSSLNDDDTTLEFASVACEILSMWPWYWMMTKISDSLMDEVIKKRIQWVFRPMLIGQVITILSLLTHQNWLMSVGWLAELVGIVFYFSIGVRCIRFGDDNVKKFGNYLVYVSFLINILIACVLVGVAIAGDGKHFIGTLCFLMAFCLAWPLRFALDTIKRIGMEVDHSTDSETEDVDIN